MSATKEVFAHGLPQKMFFGKQFSKRKEKLQISNL